jgi:hypothetical protein
MNTLFRVGGALAVAATGFAVATAATVTPLDHAQATVEDVSITAGDIDRGTGMATISMTITNTSDHEFEISGALEVLVEDTALPEAQPIGDAAAGVVDLKPGESATADVSVSVDPAAQSNPADSLRIGLPDEDLTWISVPVHGLQVPTKSEDWSFTVSQIAK